MKKTFKCLVIALIFSLAYAAMPSSVEAVELSSKWKAMMDEAKRELRRMDEKDLEELSTKMTQEMGVQNIAECIAVVKIVLGDKERKFNAEEKSLNEAERQKRLDEIEERKFVLWALEAIERRKLELAEEKQKRLNAQKNSENKPEEKSSLKETYDEYKLRKELEDREKARLKEAERQRKQLEEEAKKREEEARKREQAKKQERKISFKDMVGIVIMSYILSLFNFPFLPSWLCWLMMIGTVIKWLFG